MDLLREKVAFWGASTLATSLSESKEP